MSKKNSNAKKNNICNPNCIYFPDVPIKENSRYIDDFGVTHVVREYLCDYDDHRIMKWEKCPYYRERVKV